MKLFKTAVQEKEPEDMAERTIKAFAWWPVKLDNGQWIWLEEYKIFQTYDAGFMAHSWTSYKRFQ